MASGVYIWSQTAATNATADANVGWSEGQAPSSINDSARALMASVAKYRDDIAGAITTGGTSTAFTVTSYQIFDSLAHLNGQVIAFTPHATNGATVTLNVDSLGAKPLRSAPLTELPAGILIQGTPYTAIYNSSDAAFYLQGFYGNPYSVPIAGFLPYAGTTAPNSSFVLPYGQAISRTTYSALFALLSTTFGSGDGSTTFNIPDLRGRVVAGADGMGGVSASRLTDAVAGIDTLGDAGGAQSHTLTLSQLPTGITSSGSISVTVPSAQNVAVAQSIADGSYSPPGAGGTHLPIASGSFWSGIGTLGPTSNTMTSNNTSGAAHNNVQPTIILNYLLRVI